MDGNDLRGKNFKTHLANFHSALEAPTKPLVNNDIEVSFKNAWIDWNGNNKQFEAISTTKKRNIIKLTEQICFINDKNLIFKALIENLYQVRCMLIHGDLDASEWTHRIVQYAYLVLNDLTEDF